MPGVEAPKTEMPVDLLSPFPPVPQTNNLIIVTSNSDDPKNAKLQMPHHLLKPWQTHPIVGRELEMWCAEFVVKGHQIQNDDE